MISVLILTRDEATNLPRCLEGVNWSDDIVVLDSGSTDATPDIARAAGARVLSRTFDNEREHRLFSLREIPFRHEWVYNPDADEETPAELREEMLAAVRDASADVAAFRVRFKTMFMGRWIRRSSLYPTYVMRLFRPERINLARDINLHYEADGAVRSLQSHFIHHTFAKGMDAWKDKHRRYAEAEARETVHALGSRPIDWAGLVRPADAVRRRRALKELSFRLPCRPLLRFLYMYVWRRGFLDGRPGFVYCRLLAWYESLIVRNARAMKNET